MGYQGAAAQVSRLSSEPGRGSSPGGGHSTAGASASVAFASTVAFAKDISGIAAETLNGSAPAGSAGSAIVIALERFATTAVTLGRGRGVQSVDGLQPPPRPPRSGGRDSSEMWRRRWRPRRGGAGALAAPTRPGQLGRRQRRRRAGAGGGLGTGGSSVGAATAHLMGSAVAPAARSSRAAPVVRAFASFIMVDRWWLGVGHSLRSAARGSRQILSSGLRSISLSTPPSSSLGGGRSGAWRRGRAGAEPGAAGPPGPRKIGDAAPGAEFCPRRPSWRRRRLGTPLNEGPQ